MSQIKFKQDIPVRHNVDIFIAGGGPAGIAAAVVAARQGKKVYLAETQGCLGGMSTAGLLPVFMRFSDGINFLAAGIGQEILNELRKAGGGGPDDDRWIHAEILKRVYDKIMINSNAKFSFQTQFVSVEKKSSNVSFAICAAKSGLFAVKAKIFIDCTGDGDLATQAGAPFVKGDAKGNMMPGTLCSMWTDLDWSKIKRPGFRHDSRHLEEAFKENMFTVEDRHLPGMWKIGKNLGGGNIGHVFGVDGTDEDSLTKAFIQARKSFVEYENYYKKYLQGFEQMQLVSTASIFGIRETRRITGDYTLGIEDYKSYAVFDDEIGRYCYNIDIHPTTNSKKDMEKFKQQSRDFRYDEGESYGIPYRILIPKNLSNVLLAGRCVSTDRYMQSSIRAIPGCYITGQAAGIAAVLAVENSTDTRGVDVLQLQQRLRDVGAYLPNGKS